MVLDGLKKGFQAKNSKSMTHLFLSVSKYRILTQVSVSIRSRFECDERIGMFGKSSSPRSGNVEKWMPQLTTDVLFCADANLNIKKGVCSGDSGGPAIRRFEKCMNIFLDTLSNLKSFCYGCGWQKSLLFDWNRHRECQLLWRGTTRCIQLHREW